ncbi:MAG TPA: uracil-DNA glycosylase [Clostridia bacterium]
MVVFNNDWDEYLAGEFKKEYYLKIREFLKSEYSKHTVYPNMYDIFNALKTTPLDKVKVVLLGQDPYHNEGQAHGMCFSVKPNVEIPPSLKNIFLELHNDLGAKIPDNGCLIEWAMQGVLLLNTVLTVRAGMANSHKNIGWEIFTDYVIKTINDQKQNVVFLLWGNNAKSKKPLIDGNKHLILEAAHPSPLSAFAGFFGCCHFSKTNQYLSEHNIEPINWQISDKADNKYLYMVK